MPIDTNDWAHSVTYVTELCDCAPVTIQRRIQAGDIETLLLKDGSRLISIRSAKKCIKSIRDKEELPQKNRQEIFDLLVQGKTYREVEKLTGISKSNICVHVSRMSQEQREEIFRKGKQHHKRKRPGSAKKTA